MLSFILVHNNTHCDIQVQSFLNSSDAIERARRIIELSNGKGDCTLTASMTKQGWIYFGEYGDSNYVFVAKRETNT